MRRLCGLILSGALLSACGSSGNAVVIFPPTPNGTPATSTPTRGSGGGPTDTPTTPGGGPTKTPTRSGGGGTPARTPTRIPGQGNTLYVRMSGNDSNSGGSPGAALRTVGQAAKLLAAGVTVYVGAGRYTEPPPATPSAGPSGRITITGATGTASAPIQLIADTTGSHTGDAGDVILDGNGDFVTLIITKVPFLTVDGFTITGAVPEVTPMKVSATEIEVRSNADNVTIRNCVIGQSSTADGIRIDTSTNVLVFDNLLFQNDRGIVVTGGATGLQVINNTIVSTQRTGVALSQKKSIAPTGATLMNNIFEAQGTGLAINVDQGPPSSQDGYTGDFNLVFESSQSDQTADYNPADIIGTNDINSDALLINLDAGDVHLSHDSPALDAGDPNTDAQLVSALTERSTRDDGSLDNPPPDMGYHYP